MTTPHSLATQSSHQTCGETAQHGKHRSMLNKSPNFAYWSQFSTLEVWQVAAMMFGVDPYAMSDVTNQNGDALDLSDEERILTSAVMVGDITACPANPQAADGRTQVSVSSLISWLRQRGVDELADGLEAKKKGQVSFSSAVPDPQRRLDNLRKLGGSATYDRKNSRWKFTRISELIASEAAEGRARSSDKTVRADLVKAGNAEREAKSEGSGRAWHSGVS